MQTRPVRIALAVALCAGALFHALAIPFPQISIPEPVFEHALFCLVNLYLAALLSRRELAERLGGWLLTYASFALWLYAQLVEHSIRSLVEVSEAGRVSAQNVLALVFAPLCARLVFMCLDRETDGEPVVLIGDARTHPRCARAGDESDLICDCGETRLHPTSCTDCPHRLAQVKS